MRVIQGWGDANRWPAEPWHVLTWPRSKALRWWVRRTLHSTAITAHHRLAVSAAPLGGARPGGAMDGPELRPWAWAALLVPAAGLLVVDLVEDLRHGGALAHAAIEVGAVASIGAACAWALVADRRRTAARIAALHDDLAMFRDAMAARAERAGPAPPAAEVAPASISPRAPAPTVAATSPETAPSGADVVDGHLRAWRLSPAEQEVAWLLLKGVSIADIGAARHTSPRTAQDQARAVYRKAGVGGRAELAAVLLDATAEPQP